MKIDKYYISIIKILKQIKKILVLKKSVRLESGFH